MLGSVLRCTRSRLGNFVRSALLRPRSSQRSNSGVGWVSFIATHTIVPLMNERVVPLGLALNDPLLHTFVRRL